VKVVADSSFLIALAMVDVWWLLPQIFAEVFIPEAVYDEVVTQGAGRPGATEVAHAAWIRRGTVQDTDRVQRYRAERLGRGEAEVLALAEEMQADLVLMDDERAWEIAQRRGLAYLRSTELVLEAHRLQRLDAETAREKLMALGRKRWMSEEVLEIALRRLAAQHGGPGGE
jgi:predicted nucleic acid-binding protein